MGMFFNLKLNQHSRNKYFKSSNQSKNSNKMRIKIKSFDPEALRNTCSALENIASLTGAILSGPVPLPTRKKVFCVLRSPHVNKDAREQFETRIHARLFDIIFWTPETVDRLMALEVPSAVDVNVKL